ncbi:hypothetical protein DLR11_25125 [Salmonella enterica subsp. salamae]|uniref:LysM peptidoglycan-binding domain-containing protein n=1 Tax=Salmonella enterica subsp. salamae TaxID=59202 RepID=A0A5Y3V802_SALER|nr:LysM peptidoglycan-binding domain-containing protein [Salmonella enterica subsp. salamae]EDH0696621.1 LysM peptidoglycan-binding domain-containing protein [Salmonella enterica]EHM1753554.1 LysM peptidoglycan-binding domain-containing protein [Salmonella enterica subsp. salamae serovar 40:c:e,n,x,z15]ECI3455015.1 hypothetical protein [Salmonella enterica subsp. salamae]ECJ2328647.1 LysM peptidoglycan-binding domain-containing protein [Salmonella enterica subsp. salamae]
MTKKTREIITDVFVRIDYYSDSATILYYTHDNRVLKRIHGPRNWRLNNPGNIDYSGTTDKQKGRIGKAFIPGWVDKNGVKYAAHTAAVFESYDAGCKAQVDLLRRKYKDCNISEMTHIYAPKKDHNDPDKYAEELLASTGISPTKKFGDMTDDEIEKIAYQMRVKEGYFSTKQYYVEEWVGTTNISVSDGTRSISNYPFKVMLGDKVYNWFTNTVGKLPVIFHTVDEMPIEIKTNNSLGEEEIVYKSIGGEQTKNICLIKNGYQFAASTLPDQPNPPREKEQPKKITYIVRTEDESLDSIAIRYDVSTSELAKDNGMKEDDEIYPGQSIFIYDKRGLPVDASESLPYKSGGPTYPVPVYPQISAWPPIKLEKVGGKNSGDAIGLIPVVPDESPWMVVAINELMKFHEADKLIIEDVTDYNSEVTNKKASMKTQAWCAAFANYCLHNSGYPMWVSPTIARDVRLSPDFVRIEKPVWGCIVYLSISHATFFYGYAKNIKGNFIGLGGNQTHTINFSPFSLSIASFYLPRQYVNEHRESKKIGSYDVKELNRLVLRK